MTAVGIDFGTTNSVVARWSAGTTEALDIDQPPAEWAPLGFGRIMPSVFARGEEDRALFGWDAKRAPTSRFPAVKRLFATQQDVIVDEHGETFMVEEVATMIFSRLKKGAANQGVDPSQAVVTVPSNSRGMARHRTKVCAGMAGIEVLALINEPTAAAMAYSALRPGDQQILVFDWGGGTLDVTVLKSLNGIFMEQASKGLPTKGGLDFDSRLLRLLRDSIDDVGAWSPTQRHRFDLEVELAKIKLSTQDSTTLMLPNGAHREVTRQEFENEVRSLVDAAREPIAQCLRDIRADIGAIDAVVMVGGTSNIPIVRQTVADMLGRDPESGIDSMTAVGEGAAIAAAIMTGDLENNDFFVATEHALGTIAYDSSRPDDPQFSVLIPRNRKLPARANDVYSPVHPDQESVLIRVIEGEPSERIDHPDQVILKEWEVSLPGEAGDPNRSFDMEYAYDVDGILHVTVTDLATGTEMLRGDVSYGVTADKQAMVDMSKRARQAVESETVEQADAADWTHLDSEATTLLQRARIKVIPFLDEDDAPAVREAAQALEGAEALDQPAAKKRLREALAPYSYLF